MDTSFTSDLFVLPDRCSFKDYSGLSAAKWGREGYSPLRRRFSMDPEDIQAKVSGRGHGLSQEILSLPHKSAIMFRCF